MLKKYIIILMFFGAHLGAMNMNREPRITVGGVHREGFPEFFTSFHDPALKYMDTLLRAALPVTGRIPLIGHYQNEGTKGRATLGEYYNLRVSIALIEHESSALAAVVPASVRTALTQAGIHDLSTVEFYTNIVGDFAFPKEAPIGGNAHSCNVAFHPVLIRWRGTGTAHFNTADAKEPKLQAGIFEAHGVGERSGGIAFNRLGALNVNYHEAFSPDNGRFTYDSSKGLATFWVVGVYHGHAIVVFNMLALNQFVEQLLLTVTHQELFDDVLGVMHDICGQLSPDDAVVCAAAMNVLAPRTVAVTGASSVVDPSIVDDMTQAFMTHVQHNNFEVAFSLLTAIQDIDPEKAIACRFALEEQLG